MLDGGPSRKLRIAERHATQRPEVTQYQPEAAPQPVQERYAPAGSAPQGRARQRSNNRFYVAIAVVAVVAMSAVLVWAFWLKPQSSAVAATIERDKFQAVFMAGGQVYFGKLDIVDDSFIKLSGVFYIQSDATTAGNEGKDPQTADKDSGNMQLIKLGEEVHGPEDAMIINRDQVLFYENLKPGGKVSQLIQNYGSGK